MFFQIYIVMLFGAMGIVGFINSSRINKIARKYPSLPGWSEISQSDRKEIRKYFLYIILSLMSFLIIVFFSYLFRFG